MKRSMIKKIVLTVAMASVIVTALPNVNASSVITTQAAESEVHLKFSLSDSMAKKLHKALMQNKRVVITYHENNYYQWRKLQSLFKKLRKYSYGVEPDYDLHDKIVITSKQARKYREQVNQLQENIDQAISAGSDEKATMIHEQLLTRKSYSFYVKGTKKDANRICQDLIARIKKVNQQGVIFKYETSAVPYSGCTKVTIDKEGAGAYYWAVKYSDQQFKRKKNQILSRVRGTAEHEKSCREDYEWERRLAAEDGEDFPTYEEFCEGRSFEVNLISDLNERDQVYVRAQGANDLSDFMKLYMISDGIDMMAPPGITYTDHYHQSGTKNDAMMLKNLYQNKATGVCQDYALHEIALFSYWGIEVNYCHSDTHAWTEGRVRTDNGNLIRYEFNYGLYWPCEHGVLSHTTRNITIECEECEAIKEAKEMEESEATEDDMDDDEYDEAW